MKAKEGCWGVQLPASPCIQDMNISAGVQIRPNGVSFGVWGATVLRPHVLLCKYVVLPANIALQNSLCRRLPCTSPADCGRSGRTGSGFGVWGATVLRPHVLLCEYVVLPANIALQNSLCRRSPCTSPADCGQPMGCSSTACAPRSSTASFAE